MMIKIIKNTSILSQAAETFNISLSDFKNLCFELGRLHSLHILDQWEK